MCWRRCRKLPCKTVVLVIKSFHLRRFPSISTEMALNKLKAWRVINEEAPVKPDFYDNNDTALDAACREWLLETIEENGVTAQKVTSNRKKFKKHLAVEYRGWQELNGIALSEIYDSCNHSVQILLR
jgi:hypothetical protein